MLRTTIRLLILAGLSLAGPVAFPQSASSPPSPSKTDLRPPAPVAPLLGSGHVWLKGGATWFGGSVGDEWGVDRDIYLALEGFRASKVPGWYDGGALGHMEETEVVDRDGTAIRDFDFWWLEINTKRAFDRAHGTSIALGFGGSMFYVDGQEVDPFAGPSSTSPLADIGFGVQGFAEITWRTQHLLVGADLEYQWAFDVIDIAYSNLRLGAHLGFCF